MKEDKVFKNFAFISYSHADKKAAEELQKVLDDFHLSDALKEKYPDRPEVLREIFRDDTGLPACSNLTKEIQKQLEQSNYLIVVCSPNAVKSDWVNKEIEYFKYKRGLKYIYPFVVDGIVNAKSPNEGKECMPKALRPYKGRAANISTYSFEHAIIEILATILKIEVDEIWQRHVRLEEERKQKLKEQNDRLLIAQSRFLAEKANTLVDEGDSYTARLLALEALPKDLENPNRPYVPEAEAAFRRALSCDTKVLGRNGKGVRNVVVSPEVVFKESKGNLGLGKYQMRNFSSQVAMTAITVMQYNILSTARRFSDYDTVGGLSRDATMSSVELTLTESIWDMILEIVREIAECFNIENVQILDMLVNRSDKLSHFIEIYQYA